MIVNANYGISSNLTVGSTFTAFAGNGDIITGNVYARGLLWASNGNVIQTGGGSIGGIVSYSSNAAVVVSYPTQANSTTVPTGAFQVVGGAAVSGNLFVGGNINILGNVNFKTGNVNITNITGNIGQFFGNASGFGAMYAGIASGYLVQPQTIIQASSNFNGYSQFNMQNINSGNQASSDYIATADNGTAIDTYIDMGIASSTYNYPGFGILKPNDGYLLVEGNAITGGGNLVLTSGLNDIVFAPGGSNANNEYGRINAANVFVISSTVASTSNVTGAITVAGGIGVQGNVYSGNVYTSGLYWSSNGNIIQTGGGGITYTANVAPPLSGNVAGSQWYNTSTDTLYEYQYDGVSYHWVDITSATVNAGNISAAVNGNVYVSANVIPTANTFYSLGTPTARFNSLYLSGNTIDLGGATIKTDFNTGAFAFVPTPTSSNPNPVATVISPSGSITTVATTGGVVAAGAIGTASNAAASGTTLSNLVVSGTANIGGGANIAGTLSVAGSITGTSAFGSATNAVNNVGFIGMPINQQSSNYTLALSDQGKTIYLTANGNITVPANSVTPFPVGTVVTIVSGLNAYSNIIINTDTMYLGGNITGATGTRTITPFAAVSLLKLATTTWYISGLGLS